jgi:hypothetical protein
VINYLLLAIYHEIRPLQYQSPKKEWAIISLILNGFFQAIFSQPIFEAQGSCLLRGK